MFIKSIKTPGIAHLSYLIGSDGHACVIDPQLDFDQYVTMAAEQNCRITHIFETHRNEDFISGAPGLAKRTNATVFHGENADQAVTYAHVCQDKDSFKLGNAELNVIATPGHTKDSICLTLADTNYSSEPVAVFTGDTLFVSDVGRTDFYPDEKEHMASLLYDSLQKLLALGDHVQVYPAHGAGSVCGGGMADREFTTLGYERKHNPRLNMASKEAFVDAKIKETHYYAPYFNVMESYNVKGYSEAITSSGCQPLSSKQKQKWLKPDARPGIVIDVRSAESFREKHLRDSVSLPGGLVSAYGGWLIPYDEALLIMADNTHQAQDAYMQLVRMGYFECIGFITSIPVREKKEDEIIASIATVTADEVEERLQSADDNWLLLDVRKADEIDSQPLPKAIHSYLGHLAQSPENYNPNIKYTCMCGSDKRATVAASILKRNNIQNVDVFEGSLKAWKKHQK